MNDMTCIFCEQNVSKVTFDLSQAAKAYGGAGI